MMTIARLIGLTVLFAVGFDALAGPPLAARGATPAAFGRRCIPAGCVAPSSNTPGILGRRALPARGPHGAWFAPGGGAGRLAALGATRAFHHGLLAARQRPPVMGRTAGVSAGHPLTTAAAIEILQKGGNAFDAGVAALLVGGVVEQDLYGFGGEGLVLVYPQREGKVISVVGQGWAPRAATIDWYLERNKSLDGSGLDPVVVPGAPHAAVTVLERWGTMRFEEVAARAVEYAREGFPLRPRTASTIVRQRRFIEQWPTNRKTWLKPDGSTYEAGEVIRLPELAATLTKMVEAERAAGGSRAAGLAAARDRFYKGDIAREMVRFLREHGAPFDESDFAEFFARVEEPASVTYRGYTVYKQGFNSQGPALLQALNILENFDLRKAGHNSADYLHLLAEALKLAYADRDSYYADPAFVKVPAKGLLSKEYAKRRAAQIDMKRASVAQAAGDPLPFDDEVKSWPFWIAGRDSSPQAPPYADGIDPGAKDTTHIAVIDGEGNVFDSTPSGGWIMGGVIAGTTGVGLSTRGEQFWLDRNRAAQLRPRSRPRYTLTPSIVIRDGQPLLALGTPGGDNQEQTILQALLNIVEFPDAWYPNLHRAFELPRMQTHHLVGSFWPHRIDLNRLDVESNVPAGVIAELKSRGHDVRAVNPLSISGCATAVMLDPRTGARIAGADPRRDCYAFAY
ncbi:MAG TPA: gamma-glutamyltransferase family protein [Vicinamibacterales bacterium]|nr:gamma-glutamyltransferase family protein [Vicinamibacterales bacterium]